MRETIIKFGDIVNLNTARVADPLSAGIERFVGLEHITPEDLHIHSWGLVAEGTTFTNFFKPGQVLFGKRRAYQRKVAVADFEGVCSGDIYVFESKDPNVLLPELLPFICQTEGFYNHAVGTSAGSLSPRTNWSQLAEYEFPLPPLAEQRRIAELLWAVEDTLESFNKLLTGSQLLRDSLREEVYYSTSIPKILLKSISSIRYGLGQPPLVTETGLPIIRATNISKGKIFNKDIIFTKIEHLPGNRAIFLKPGDIILVRSGAYTGDSAIITKDWENAIAGYDLVISPNHEQIDPHYLSEFFLHTKTIHTILFPLSARSAQPHINAEQVGNILVPIPLMSDQKEQCEKLKSINDTLAVIVQRTNTHKYVKKTILSSLW
jgi:type I restriction enzyme S subunit